MKNTNDNAITLCNKAGIPASVFNVRAYLQDGELTLKVKMNESYQTKKGKTKGIASTHGNVFIPGTTMRIGLNIFDELTPVQTSPVQTSPVQTSPVQTSPVQKRTIDEVKAQCKKAGFTPQRTSDLLEKLIADDKIAM